MNKEDFERLKASVIEAGQILRGEKATARETVYEVPEKRSASWDTFAVCVATDDPTLLIPHKIYAVTLYDDRYVRVVDEAGETTIYPADFFMPISLPQEIETTLAKTA